MKKIIRLTERDLTRIVKRVISEKLKYNPKNVVHMDDEHIVINKKRKPNNKYKKKDVSYEDDEWMVIDLEESEDELKEQLILGALNTGKSLNVAGVGKETPMLATGKEIIIDLFKKARGWNSTDQDWNSIKSIADQMHKAMSGMGSGNFLELLKKIDTTSKLAALVKKFKYDGSNLYEWISGEWGMSWDSVVKALRPKFGSYMIKTKPQSQVTIA
jgi:hypothetical protein